MILWIFSKWKLYTLVNISEWSLIHSTLQVTPYKKNYTPLTPMLSCWTKNFLPLKRGKPYIQKYRLFLLDSLFNFSLKKSITDIFNHQRFLTGQHHFGSYLFIFRVTHCQSMLAVPKFYFNIKTEKRLS
jgi:hypothetical protein